MLATGFMQCDAAEFSFVIQNAHIFEPLRTNQSGVGFILNEQGDVFRQLMLSGIVPVVQVGVGYDDCIGAFNHLCSGQWQPNPRVAKFAAVGVRKARISALLCQHRVDQKGGVSVGDFDAG